MKLKNREKYYLLGFFYADASISKTNRIDIKLGYKDFNFLKQIGKVFNLKVSTYNSIYKGIEYRACRLVINSENGIFWNKLGIVQNKTYQNNASIFNNIPEKYKWDFIRGYFDGDGSIYKVTSIKESLYPKHIIGFVSLNKKLLNSIRIYINKNLGLKAKLRLDKKYYRLIYSGNIQVKKICFYLYKNKGNLFLERKYLISKDITVFKPKFYAYDNIRKNWKIDHNKFNKYLAFKSEKEAKNYVSKKLKEIQNV